ncbi:hypothetical protein HIM_11282 [Hirsutella minnesotensis 3608]|uniref:C2H2-type domain-containing protein n=1 Tax=Hirsutella minnesotensis 3608 TaxID=1043627 RepID=A0A0F8A1E0_9HYPO|nr:hypothetical protein HIM_11282 [Hirsutella minnesotensis 3608]
MTSEIYQRNQCTCSAIFLTSEGLDSHLGESRSLETYLAARLKICRSHAKAHDSDDPLTENEDDSGIDKCNINKQHCCPVKECDRRATPFTSRQRLRRHFQQHVKCDEICVFCHQVFKRVRDYIRHAERHQDAQENTKRTYINQMCEELRDMADEELESAENSCGSADPKRAKKRTSDAAGLDTLAGGARRPRHDKPETVLGKRAQFPYTNGTCPREHDYTELTLQGSRIIHEQSSDSTQLAARLISPATGAEPVTDCLASVPVDVLLTQSVEAATALDDFIFDAPVNGIVNFPDFIEQWTESTQL